MHSTSVLGEERDQEHWRGRTWKQLDWQKSAEGVTGSSDPWLWALKPLQVATQPLKKVQEMARVRFISSTIMIAPN